MMGNECAKFTFRRILPSQSIAAEHLKNGTGLPKMVGRF
jgi:hypothetical protein